MKLPESMEVFDDIAAMQTSVADAIGELVVQSLADRDRFCVALSGGSTPRRIYELLATQDLPWQSIHWFWGDERNVPGDHEDSNARMVRQAILDHVPAPRQNIHAVAVNTADPAAAALAYEAELQQCFAGHSFPGWDLCLLGLGDDAHTASLFPGTKAVGESDRWFVENWVEKLAAFRYTLTAPAINSARQVWFIVSGKQKQQALQDVLSKPRQVDLFPAQLIRPTRWFVTREVLQ